MNVSSDDSNERAVPAAAEAQSPIPGACGLAVAKLFAPKPPETRRMLKELRKRLGWTQMDAAQAIGVSPSCLTKWESGTRRPNGAALRLIFALHKRLVEADQSVGKAWDLAFWGQVPAANSENTTVDISAAVITPEPTQEPMTAEAGRSEPDPVALRHLRAATTQRYLAYAMQRVHQAIVGLPDGESRFRHLRELSAVQATLASRMAEALEVSIKLAGASKAGFEESGPLVPSFRPGSVVCPG